MSRAFKPVWVIFLGILAVSAISAVSRLMAAKEIVEWGSDYAAARAESASSGRPVLAYFTASWCGPCQEMKRTTFADPAVKAALGRFAAVKIDLDQHADLAQQFQVDGIPAFFVVSPAGKVIASTDGYHSSAEFLSWLKRIPAATQPSAR